MSRGSNPYFNLTTEQIETLHQVHQRFPLAGEVEIEPIDGTWSLVRLVDPARRDPRDRQFALVVDSFELDGEGKIHPLQDI